MKVHGLKGLYNVNGYGSVNFIIEMASLYLLGYGRNYASIKDDNYPWKSIRFLSWMNVCSFSQVWQALKVIVGNQSLCLKLKNNVSLKDKVIENVEVSSKGSQENLNIIDRILRERFGKGIYFSTKGSMYIARTQAEEVAYAAGQKYLATLGRDFQRTNDIKEANSHFGTKLDESRVAFIKKDDRVFLPGALGNIRESIALLGGEVVAWELVTIHYGGEGDYHVAEFFDPVTQNKKFIRASKIHTSLGAVQMQPRQVSMVSAIGVSCSLIIKGKLYAPVVLGCHHLSPQSLPIEIDGQVYTLITATTGAQIGPRNPKPCDRYLLDDKDLFSLLAQVQNIFPDFILLSAKSCWRVVSAKNFREDKNFKGDPRICFTVGCGGGGMSLSADPSTVGKIVPTLGRIQNRV